MHPYQHIALTEHHIADLQATARRHRFARLARHTRHPVNGPPSGH